MTDEEVLTELSVKDGAPQYLLLARRSPYQILKKEYPLYEQLENLAANEKNNVILTP